MKELMDYKKIILSSLLISSSLLLFANKNASAKIVNTHRVNPVITKTEVIQPNQVHQKAPNQNNNINMYNINNNSNNNNQFNNKNNNNKNIHNIHNNHRIIKHSYYKPNNIKPENYYTYVRRASRWHNHRGYAIYTSPYNTSARSLTPKGYQKSVQKEVAHVIKSEMVNHENWLDIHSGINGWIKPNALNLDTRWLNVPLIPQRPQLPSGCEVTATTMMLKYRDGHKINKMKMAREMPRSSNPNYGFVGSPYSSSGWWIAPNGLKNLVNKYTHHKVFNMTGLSQRKIEAQINNGIPVVLWVGYMDGFPNHALTVYGYNNNRHQFFVNDPWYDSKRHLSIKYLWYKHAEDPVASYGALSYHK